MRMEVPVELELPSKDIVLPGVSQLKYLKSLVGDVGLLRMFIFRNSTNRRAFLFYLFLFVFYRKNV